MHGLFVSAIFTTLFVFVNGDFSGAFQNHLKSKYGAGTHEALTRSDIGGGGSFGGGSNGNVKHKPVIVVHGITNSAGHFARIQQFFKSHGYSDNEIYGTTYGDAGKTNVLFVTMSCHYMKVIRMMIITVNEYTNSKVNVMGYSMGSPVARKAILGGRCVDTGEELGGSLTNRVDTFVGVAGANFGSALCVFPFGSCNTNNGMHCTSSFLADINARQRYEATNKIFTIYSTNDDKVGYMSCGRKASAIIGENGAFEKQGMNHDQLMFDTVALQFNLVTFGHA
uniref:Lipase domain-containing protein n=1 Tax=Panagrellus redivivus TaxID=6233 RepID=A0A7E4WCG5_PANRE